MPEPPCVRLPQDRPGVVVAARAERLSELGVTFRMSQQAPGRRTVWAGLPRRARPTDTYPSAALTPRVHRPEARSGEGGEHPGVPAHLLRDVLAADHSGTDELVRIRLVDACACRADGRPAVAAGGEQPPAVRIRGVRQQHFPVPRVEHGRAADQMNGVCTAAEADDVPAPRVEAGFRRPVEESGNSCHERSMRMNSPR